MYRPAKGVRRPNQTHAQPVDQSPTEHVTHHANNVTHHANNVLPDYILGQEVGRGAYGIVHQAKHASSGLMVAIKAIRGLDNPSICRRTLREIKLLRHFKHGNIVSMREILKPRSMLAFSTVYVVMEWMDLSLHDLLSRRGRHAIPLDDSHHTYFTYQILRGLKAIHAAGVMHRDLKPANILITTSNCDLKICDFGLARGDHKDDSKSKKLTEYVTTRWYRAPEVLMMNAYSTALDMWAVGCILAEILSRKPLFPGKEDLHQLQLILATLGSEDLGITELSVGAKAYLDTLPRSDKVPWSLIFPDASGDAVSLLDQLLVFDPKRRATAAQALAHPYVSMWSTPEDEDEKNADKEDETNGDAKESPPDIVDEKELDHCDVGQLKCKYVPAMMAEESVAKRHDRQAVRGSHAVRSGLPPLSRRRPHQPVHALSSPSARRARAGDAPVTGTGADDPS